MKTKDYCIIDIESFKWVNFLIGGIVYDDNNKDEYFITQDFEELFFETLKFDFCFAFNLNFDGGFIIEYAIQNKIPISNIVLSGGKLLSFKIKNTYFRDLYQFYITSVEKASEKYLKEKLKYKIDYEKILEIPLNELTKYLKNDLMIEHRLLKHQLDNGVDIFKYYSIRGYAFNYLINGLNIISRNIEDVNVRKQYFGGRCELYSRKVNEKGFVYDVNSLYPFAMIQRIPIDFQSEISKKDYLQLTSTKNNFDVLMLCDVIDSGGMFPIKVNEKNQYQKGIRKNVLIYESIIKRFGIEKNILAKKRFFLFKTGFLNIERIIDLYEKKKKNELYKLMLNSSYGKFGIDDEFFEYIIGDYSLLKEGDIVMNDERNFVLIKRKKESKRISKKNVFIAKFITDFSRMYVWNDIQKIHSMKYKVHYTDTDSIHTNMNPEIFNEHIHRISENIGDYKIENVFSSAVYRNPKDYTLNLISGNNITKKKGFVVKKENDEVIDYYEKMSILETLKTGNFLCFKIYKKDVNEKYFKKIKNERYLYSEIDYDYFNIPIDK